VIEDILATYATEGFVVSNTFQVAKGDWTGAAVGWDVYIRNLRNTRSGHGHGATLEEALRDAHRVASQGPTYQRPERSANGPAMKPSSAFSQTERVPILGDREDNTSEELF
jgi:hypothetical protein